MIKTAKGGNISDSHRIKHRLQEPQAADPQQPIAEHENAADASFPHEAAALIDEMRPGQLFDRRHYNCVSAQAKMPGALAAGG